MLLLAQNTEDAPGFFGERVLATLLGVGLALFVAAGLPRVRTWWREQRA